MLSSKQILIGRTIALLILGLRGGGVSGKFSMRRNFPWEVKLGEFCKYGTDRQVTCDTGEFPKHPPSFRVSAVPELIGSGSKVLVCLFRSGHHLVPESAAAAQGK